MIVSACAQVTASNGLYQVISGSYIECCGIAGPIMHSLPDSSQPFVALTIDHPGDQARMTFLGQDKSTVFCAGIDPDGNGPAFCFVLTNGTVFADHIQFGDAVPPAPGQPYLSYVVSNSSSGIEINGTVVSESVCCDIPNAFSHSNVLAALVGSPELVIDSVQGSDGYLSFHFYGEPPYDYTVEYSESSLSTNWLALATYRAKIAPIDVLVTDSFTNASPRFFRLRKQPCYCR